MRRSLVVAALILAACSGNSEATTTPAPPLPTTLADVTAPPTTTTTTVAPPPTTTTTTTTTLPPNDAADLGLTQVVLGDAAILVKTNRGNASGNLDGYWLCQLPSCEPLPDTQLSPGEQALIGLAAAEPPALAGIRAIVDLGPAIGVLEAAGGEIAMYRSDPADDPAEFLDDPTKIVAYVAWGESDHQGSAVAAVAGIWDESTVAVFDEAPSISSGVHPAVSNDDWSADVGG